MAGVPDDFLFPTMSLDGEMVNNLRRFNPWWEGLPGVVCCRPIVATLSMRFTNAFGTGFGSNRDG